MKKNLLAILSLIALTTVFTGCNKDEEEDTPITTADKETIAEVDEAESIFDQINTISDDAIDEVDNVTNGRLSRAFEGCADVAIDFDNSEVIVDFGDGCEGEEGRIAKGRVIVTFAGTLFETGFSVSTTLQDFYVDGVKVEGTRTVTTLSSFLAPNPKHEIKLTDGKITWLDGKITTRDVVLERTWVKNQDLTTNEFVFSGTASGSTREGKAYTASITTDLVYKVACAEQENYIAAAGVKEVTVDGSKFSVDYGDGTCDNLVTLSRGSNSVEIDVTDF